SALGAACGRAACRRSDRKRERPPDEARGSPRLCRPARAVAGAGACGRRLPHRMGGRRHHPQPRGDRGAYFRSGGALSRHEIHAPFQSGDWKMSDQPTANNQDKTPPLPNLERDVDMVARAEAPSTAPEDSMSPKMAADLEAVLDVPVHVSAVLGRTRMD